MTLEGTGLADEGSFAPVEDGLTTRDPLGYPGYENMLAAARERAGTDESVVTGPARIGGHEVELVLFQFAFLGGSMGEIAGERIARTLERGTTRGVPVVMRTATGGARMQEGMRSLVQMAKVVAARDSFASAGRPLIGVFGNPTTGGVFASIGSLCDIAIAEAGATVGFAGPRLVENFTGKPLDRDSHTAETALKRGLVDTVVEPGEVRTFLKDALDVLAPDVPGDAMDAAGVTNALDLVTKIADGIVELRGDRDGTDEPAVRLFVARAGGRRRIALVMDGRHAPGPGAYRKARRGLDLAQRWRVPIITFIDTHGADPSEVSEGSGIAAEIARTFEAMLTVDAPTLSVVVGEGGSGGALALAVTDRLLILRGATFSVIAPSLAAEILWRDPTRADEATGLLKPDAATLKGLGIADEVVDDWQGVGTAIDAFLDLSATMWGRNLQAARRERWRRIDVGTRE